MQQTMHWQNSGLDIETCAIATWQQRLGLDSFKRTFRYFQHYNFKQNYHRAGPAMNSLTFANAKSWLIFMTRPQKIEFLKRDLFENYHFSQAEASVLLQFKGSSCRFLNQRIRNGQLTETEKKLCENLYSGLLKLPPTKEQIIYRHLNFQSWQFANAKDYFMNNINKIIRFKEFQSCSIRESFTGDPNDYNWTMKILTSSDTLAKDIHILWDKYDLNDSEKEILLPNNACFEVLSVDIKSNIKVYLKEVSSRLQALTVPQF